MQIDIDARRYGGGSPGARQGVRTVVKEVHENLADFLAPDHRNDRAIVAGMEQDADAPCLKISASQVHQRIDELNQINPGRFSRTARGHAADGLKNAASLLNSGRRALDRRYQLRGAVRAEVGQGRLEGLPGVCNRAGHLLGN